MAMGDLPTFIDSGHAHTVYGLGNLSQGTVVAGTTGFANLMAQAAMPADDGGGLYRALKAQRGVKGMIFPQAQQLQQEEEKVSRRLVQVLIADPNENVPLEDSLLYRGEQKLTDATDQELFYEIDINTILKAHNEKRVTFIDKKVKERTENLEPARIRDLTMIVVTVASF